MKYWMQKNAFAISSTFVSFVLGMILFVRDASIFSLLITPVCMILSMFIERIWNQYLAQEYALKDYQLKQVFNAVQDGIKTNKPSKVLYAPNSYLTYVPSNFNK